MPLNRRQLMILTAAVAAGCKRNDDTARAPSTRRATTAPVGSGFDAGPVGDFKADDVYTDHRDDGFFVIRRDKTLFALSSVCTHKGCKVRVADDLSFFCKCHKSTFDRDGRVTKGPAKRDLPCIPVATDEGGHLHIKLDGVPRPDGANEEPEA